MLQWTKHMISHFPDNYIYSIRSHIYVLNIHLNIVTAQTPVDMAQVYQASYFIVCYYLTQPNGRSTQ